MGLEKRHVGLLVGLFSFITSFLFFGRQEDIYLLMLLGGLLTSLVFYVIVLIKSKTAKSIILWTAISGSAVFVQRLTEPLMIKCSYLIYVEWNSRDLTAINQILKDKPGKIYVLADEIRGDFGSLTQAERDQLALLQKRVHAYFISKSDGEIYFGLYGMLKVRLGVFYYTSQGQPPGKQYHHIVGDWWF